MIEFDVYSKGRADEVFVKTVNGQPPGPGGNVTVAAEGVVASKATAYFPLDVPTFDLNPSVGHPSVVYAPEGWNGYRYWMAFTPFPTAVREDPCIVASNDGVNWEEPPGIVNPVCPNSTALAMGYDYWADTDLVLVGGVMVLIFKGTDTGVSNHYVRMTSTDGVSWSAPVVCVTDAGVSPAIFEESGALTMIECKADTLQRRTSTDLGATWSAPVPATSRPRLAAPWNLHHVDVVRIGTTYHALANASGGTGGPTPFRVFYWQSNDLGATWTGSGSTPAVPLTGTRFDTRGHYRSTFNPAASGEPGAFDLWLTMMDETGVNHTNSVWRIGHIKDFSFTDGEAWPFPITPAAELLAESDVRVVTASSMLPTGTALRGRIPDAQGGVAAIGLAATGKGGADVVFEPVPPSWSHFTLDALLVHDDPVGGGMKLHNWMGRVLPGHTIKAGAQNTPAVFAASPANTPTWVQLNNFTPTPTRQGALVSWLIERQGNDAADTLASTVWVLAVRLRRVRKP